MLHGEAWMPRQEVSSSFRGRILLIAYHFPPASSSTGHLRTLGFMRHLPAFGWEPIVLTVNPRAYVRTDPCGLDQVPNVGSVYRAYAFDTRQQLGWRGKYFSLFSMPDRWISWWPDGVRLGLKLIRQYQIDAIWSTYPIMTSHLIALSLARRTGLPWIADFRDPVKPTNTMWLNRKISDRLEKSVMERASRVVFTTPGAERLYAKRFANSIQDSEFAIIPNGYEETAIPNVSLRERQPGKCVTLVHSGHLYRDGRNPIPFFRALAKLKSSDSIDNSTLRVILRASGNENEYQRELNRLDVSDLVSLQTQISYEAALREQMMADGLLLFQGDVFNAQIPAKVYEYMRIGRPIFALVGLNGDTATLLRKTGGAIIVSHDDERAIAEALKQFVSQLNKGEAEKADPEVVAQFSRLAGTEKLVTLLDSVVK